MSTGSRHTVVEAVLALGAGVAWFTVCSVLLGVVLPHAFVVMVAVVAMAVAVVLAVARYWEIPYAVTVGVAEVVALDWYYIPPTASARRFRMHATCWRWRLPADGCAARGAGRPGASPRECCPRAHDGELAGEQAALRRVATLVARETAPAEVFAAVTEEVGRLLEIDISTMLRYETGRHATVVAAWSEAHRHIPVGTRVSLEGDNVAEEVLRNRPAGADRQLRDTHPVPWRPRCGSWGSARAPGARSPSPDRIGVSWWPRPRAEPIAAGTEARLGEFTELAATAVANAQARTELTASTGADRRGRGRGTKTHRARPARRRAAAARVPGPGRPPGLGHRQDGADIGPQLLADRGRTGRARSTTCASSRTASTPRSSPRAASGRRSRRWRDGPPFRSSSASTARTGFPSRSRSASTTSCPRH